MSRKILRFVRTWPIFPFVDEKNPAAVALANKRWEGKTEQDRLEVGRKLAAARKKAARRRRAEERQREAAELQERAS